MCKDTNKLKNENLKLKIIAQLLLSQFYFVNHEPCFLAGIGVPGGECGVADEAELDEVDGLGFARFQGVAQAAAVVLQVAGRVLERQALPRAPFLAVDAP